MDDLDVISRKCKPWDKEVLVLMLESIVWILEFFKEFFCHLGLGFLRPLAITCPLNVTVGEGMKYFALVLNRLVCIFQSNSFK